MIKRLSLSGNIPEFLQDIFASVFKLIMFLILGIFIHCWMLLINTQIGFVAICENLTF